MDLLKNKHYFIATKLPNSLIKKENKMNQSHENKQPTHHPDSDINDQDDFEQKWINEMEDYHRILIKVSVKWDPFQYNAQAMPIYVKLTAFKPQKDMYFYNFGIYLEDIDE